MASSRVSDGDITITTATLPLSVARTRLDPGDPDYEPQIIPELPDIAEMQVQKDYNEYIAVACQFRPSRHRGFSHYQ